MSRTRKSRPNIDANMGLLVARTFRNRVKDQLASRRTPLNAKGQLDIGELAFQSTNIIFAVEVYLKLVLTLEGRPYSVDHNVWTLFCKISSAHRSSIETAFNAKMAMYPSDMLATSLELQMRVKGGTFPDESPRKDKKEILRLKTILKETGTSYVAWRYLFGAMNEKNKNMHIVFHHVGLDFLCEVLDDYILAAFSKGT